MLNPLLFIVLLLALSRAMRSRCLGKFLYAYDWAFDSESLEISKGKLEAWKRALESREIQSEC